VNKIINQREAIKVIDTALRNVSADEAQRQAYLNRLIINNDNAHRLAMAERRRDEYWQPQVNTLRDEIAALRAENAALKAAKP